MVCFLKTENQLFFITNITLFHFQATENSVSPKREYSIPQNTKNHQIVKVFDNISGFGNIKKKDYET